MDLYLLRHTSAADPHGYAQDADRPLTEAGRYEAERVAEAMRCLGWQPELVLTSPYRRARETATIVAAHLKTESPTDVGGLLPGADHMVLLEHLSARRAQAVLLVGHAPDLPQLLALLCCGEEIVMAEMSKGALVHLQAERPLRKRRALLRSLIPLRLAARLTPD